MASNHGRVAHLLPAAGLQKMVTAWLEEDCPTFDHGGFVVGEHMAEAKLLGKGTVRSIVFVLLVVLLPSLDLFRFSLCLVLYFERWL